MKVDELANQKVLVLGLGREGLSVINFLQKHLPDLKVAVADQTEKVDLPANVEQTFFGKDYLSSIKDYEVVIKSPGITPLFPELIKAKNAGVVFTSLTELFFAYCPGQIIGVTGTKGKSTTASLIYEVLKAGGKEVVLIGNIGKPALDFLDEIDGQTLVIYEISSYQLESLKVSPHIAVITNIYEEHLNWHGSFEQYLKAKLNITLFQNEADYFIYNKDFAQFQEVSLKTRAKLFPYNLENIPHHLLPGNFKLSGEFLINTIPAAIIGQLIFGLSDEQIKQGFANFNPLPHRLEYVEEVRGIKFYNDSLATIPQATINALKTLGSDVETLIAGGFDRGIDYAPLGQYLANSSVKNLILFPTTGEQIWQEVQKINPSVDIKKIDVDNMEQAVKLAFEVTSSGKSCLLSPASSSFNLFKDYADRGDQFKKYVLELSKV